MKKPKYPNLAGEMARRGYTVIDVASEIGMEVSTLRSRLSGATDFKLPEMVKIRNLFERYIDIDFLFVRDTEYDNCEE